MNIRLVRQALSLSLFGLLFPYLFSGVIAAAQQEFASPEDAAQALLHATESDDRGALAVLFGSDFMQYVSSGDPQADRVGVQRLGTLMQQGYKLSPQGGRKVQIQLGADKWPFPLPVELRNNGAWAFDVREGTQELLRRRLQANEDRAVEIAQIYAGAQRQYFAMTARASGVGSYAKKFLSSSGKKDGLYWDVGADGVTSPLAPLVARAENLGYRREGRESPLLMGYYYRVLTAQGEFAPGKSQSYLDASGRMTKGFALLAYPSRYGISGRMSFIVGPDGVVYSRDLGERTQSVGSQMSRFDPDPAWHAVAGRKPIAAAPSKVISTSDWTVPFYTK